MNVLAFTCSKHRPALLRACCLQMQQQTHPVTHAVYINADDVTQADEDYRALLSDIGSDTHPLIVGFGPSFFQHKNHLSAIQLVDWEAYDLFLKIDDDDIYRKTYIASVIEDLKANHWDFSGTFSNGLVNGKRWLAKYKITHLGFTPEDEKLGVLPMVPPSYAFTKKAMAEILSLDSELPGWEDPIWRQHLTAHPDIRVHVREHSDVSLHIHPKNVSMGKHYNDT